MNDLNPQHILSYEFTHDVMDSFGHMSAFIVLCLAESFEI